jgi:hypothetical protein
MQDRLTFAGLVRDDHRPLFDIKTRQSLDVATVRYDDKRTGAMP